MLKKILSLVLTCFIIPISQVYSQDNLQYIDSYDLNELAFTQGLEIFKDNLFISSGLYGESYLARIDLESGQIEDKIFLDEQYFAEGITFTPNYLWQITWREGKAFKRDPQTFEVLEEIVYPGEGWGIAYDEDLDCLWMTDGSHYIFQRDSETFALMDQYEIHYQGRPISLLNELEYVDGYLLANIWYSPQIIAISLETFEIEAIFDVSPLIEEAFSQDEIAKLDSLNGIAHKEDQTFYITGKYYPKIFEVELKIE